MRTPCKGLGEVCNVDLSLFIWGKGGGPTGYAMGRSCGKCGRSCAGCAVGRKRGQCKRSVKDGPIHKTSSRSEKVNEVTRRECPEDTWGEPDGPGSRTGLGVETLIQLEGTAYAILRKTGRGIGRTG